MTVSSTSLPFQRIGHNPPISPIILSVPHAGRAYSAALLRTSRLKPEELILLEDRLMDQLVWRATASGAAAIIAHSPRAEIDLNRDEREIDPAMIIPAPPAHSVIRSSRVQNGLGLIPSRITNLGPIWLHRISQHEIQRRINHIHRPYHEAIARAMQQAQAIFGTAILLDCHSMPPRNRGEATIILGDLHGTSIASPLLAVAHTIAQAKGFNVACNTPYAGGYIIQRHGRPKQGFHALQLEIDRSLYLDATLRSPGSGFDDIANLIAAISAAMVDQVINPDAAIAAE